MTALASAQAMSVTPKVLLATETMAVVAVVLAAAKEPQMMASRAMAAMNVVMR